MHTESIFVTAIPPYTVSTPVPSFVSEGVFTDEQGEVLVMIAEPAVMELVASVTDPALFVLDYVVNAGLEGFKKTLPGAIDIIRRRHPEVPIALLTPMHLCRELWIPQRAADFREVCDLMRDEAARRRASGDANVHFVNGTVESSDWFEYMVDGVHLTDLGFYKQTELVAPQLEKLL